MPKVKLLTHLILIVFLFCSCNNNNDKIESLELQNTELKNQIAELKNELGELKVKLNSNSEFDKEMRCQEMLDRLKIRWNNVIGCYYSTSYNTCMVKYVMNDEVKESKIEDMKDSDY